LSVVEAEVPDTASGHHRDLVERKRPGHTRRDHERDRPRGAVEAGKKLVDPDRLARWKRCGTVEGGVEPTAGADDQVLVVDAWAVGKLHEVTLRVDAPDLLQDEAGLEFSRQGGEFVALRGLEAKGLLDEQGLIEKVRIWGNEDEIGACPGEGMQRKQRFQSGNAAANDDDTRMFGIAVPHSEALVSGPG
jgi:hypothetical protein